MIDISSRNTLIPRMSTRKKKEKDERVEKEVPTSEEKKDVPAEKIWMKHVKPNLTKFERTRILATRCAQLQGGAPLNLTPDEIANVRRNPDELNYEDLARLEMAMGRIPFIIERVLPGLDAEGKPRVVRIPIQDLN